MPFVEYRRLPEFPLYEITDEGDVRHRHTLKPLAAQQRPGQTAWHYKLYLREGRPEKSTRGMMGLIYSAFPELLADWRPIPGFPDYLVNRQGEVLSTKTYERISTYNNRPGIYRLRKDGKRVYWSMEDWSQSAIDELFAQEEAA